MLIEHLSLLLEGFRRLCNGGRIGRPHAKESLDQVLKEQRHAGIAAPVRALPVLPAHDVGARSRIVRPQRTGFFAGEILHDGVRLPEHEIAVDERRGAAGRIQSQILRRPIIALYRVQILELERYPEVGGERANFPGARRTGESVELHCVLLGLVTVWKGSEPGVRMYPSS